MIPLSSSSVVAVAVAALVAAGITYLLCRTDSARRVAETESRLGTSEALARAEVQAARSRTEELQREREQTRNELEVLRKALMEREVELERLRTGSATFDARMEDLMRAQSQLKESFQALSGEALRQNNEQFLQLARTELERVGAASADDLAKKESAIRELLAPIREGLEKYETKVLEIERERTSSFGTLTERLRQMADASDGLKSETQRLVQALRSPVVRGRWGEIQLQRVVELAGMLEYCDFDIQQGIGTENGQLRPDMSVRLPNGKTIVVDAKTPLVAFLDATEAKEEEVRREHLKRHAKHVRTHCEALRKKNYWEQFQSSPEFVVLFLPGEVFFSAALEQDPSLLEEMVGHGVILATPTTLIALLKAVAFGWRQERITQNAVEISRIGKELYDRIGTMGAHMADLGKGLQRAVECYNRSIGSIESRVLVSARRFPDLGITATDEIGALVPLDVSTRSPQAPELRERAAAGE